MKKKILLSMALLSVATGSMTATVRAAETETAQIGTGECYKVLSEQEIAENECLKKILDAVDGIISNALNYCPNISNHDMEIPDTEALDAETPDTEVPAEETPDIEVPDVGIPDTEVADEETPDIEVPDVGIPDIEVPGEGIPDMETPDVQNPEEDTNERSYAEQVVYLVNQERAKAGLPELNMQTDITAAANVRAKEIQQSFSHTRPNGSSFSSALKEQGISFIGSGENIAYGQKTPEQVMEGWMNSEGHRANILNGKYKNIGVGYDQDERGVNYWVQLFTY